MKLKPKKRIIKKAGELFYLKGFPNTHIADIMEESGTYKKSFYRYFRDKNDLAMEYLDFQEDRILRNTRKLSKKFNSYEDFIHYWMRFNRKLFQGPRFAGCPFANFALQTLNDKSNFHKRIHEFMKKWENVLVDFLRRLQEEGSIPKNWDLNPLAKRILLIYEGGVYSFIMSNDLEYLDLTEKEMLTIPNHC